MNRQEFADAVWQNDLQAMNECEAAYKEYLATRQRIYEELGKTPSDPAMRYANDEAGRAYNHYHELRSKAWASARKKNAELRKKMEQEEMYQ